MHRYPCIDTHAMQLQLVQPLRPQDFPDYLLIPQFDDIAAWGVAGAAIALAARILVISSIFWSRSSCEISAG